MRLRDKRAQAALEFLTTYGWAFLVILVMIGALAYFGVLNPDRFLPKRCSFGQEFRCTDSIIINDDNRDIEFAVWLVNNKGTAVTVTDINVNDEAGHQWLTADCQMDGGVLPYTWRPGDAVDINCSSSEGATFPPDGSKAKLDFMITFTPIGGRYPDKVGGELYSTVIDP